MTDPDIAAHHTLIEAMALHTAALTELTRIRGEAEELIGEALLTAERLREITGRLHTCCETVERVAKMLAMARGIVDDTPVAMAESDFV